jgi:putative transposase
LASAKHQRRVSAIGALALSPSQHRASLYYQRTFESFKTPKVIEFLRQLHRQLGRKIIIVWDRLNAHRSTATWYAANQPNWFQFEWLPGYAPELNPVESCWSHSKCHDLSNLCANDVDELAIVVDDCLAGERHRQKLLLSFFSHAGLDL